MTHPPGSRDSEVPPQRELIASAAHELRQPLASIRGFTEMLLAHWADFADSDKVAMLKEVHHDALRVGQLVDELVWSSRGETGDRRLHERPTDLSALIKRVVRTSKFSYPDLEAALEIPGTLPLVVLDPFKIEQVLANIVENACRHGAAGNLIIKAAHRAGDRGDVVEVAISDRGPGIPEEELPHVAEKFFRGKTGAADGLGLGLWTSKAIVEAHGGHLDAASRRGGGTTVRFTIPLGPHDRSQVRPGAASGKLAGS